MRMISSRFGWSLNKHTALGTIYHHLPYLPTSPPPSLPYSQTPPDLTGSLGSTEWDAIHLLTKSKIELLIFKIVYSEVSLIYIWTAGQCYVTVDDFKKRRYGVIFTISHLILLTTPQGRQSWDLNTVASKACIFTLHYTASPWTLKALHHLTPMHQNSLTFLHSCLPLRLPSGSQPSVYAVPYLFHMQNGLVVLFVSGWDLNTTDQEDNNITMVTTKRKYKLVMCHTHYVIGPSYRLFHLIFIIISCSISERACMSGSRS